MPTPKPYQLFAEMYSDRDGAPFLFDAFQELTGLYDFSLEETDTSKIQEFGVSPNELSLMKLFVSRIQNIQKKERYSFCSRADSSEPGKGIWHLFVNKFMKESNLESRIAELLTANLYHPEQMYAEHGEMVVPPSMILSTCSTELMDLLWGRDGFDKSGRPIPYLFESAQYLLTNTVGKLRSRTRRTIATKRKMLREVMEIRRQISEGTHKLTHLGIRKLLLQIEKFMKQAQVLGDNQSAEECGEQLTFLKDIMDGIDADKSLEENRTKQGKLSKLGRQMLEDLTSEEDFRAAMLSLRDIIDNEDGEVLSRDFFTAPTYLTNTESNDVAREAALSGDIGVDEEKNMSLEKLNYYLGLDKKVFLDASPLAKFRTTGGANEWDAPREFNEDGSLVGDDGEKLEPRWVQKAGVLAMLRRFFFASITTDPVPGILLADEVGVGKTYQAVLLVCWLMAVQKLVEMELPVPPIVESRPYFAGNKAIPDLPYLFVLPNTLFPQWHEEFRNFTRKARFDIFLYNASTWSEFWLEHSAWSQSRMKRGRRVILATSSMVERDAKAVYTSLKKPRVGERWKELPRRGHPPDTGLFQLNYCVTFVDEAHLFRNRPYSLIGLRERSQIIVLLTATPLVTNFPDLFSLGRVLGIPNLMNAEADRAEEEARRQQNKLRGRVKAGEKGEIAGQITKGVMPRNERLADALAHAVAIVRTLHACFAGHIIRRGIDSRDHEGNMIIDLPMYDLIAAWLELSDEEMKALHFDKEALKDGRGLDLNSLIAVKFYLEYRKCIGHHSVRDTGAIARAFTSIEEWHETPSSKMNMVLTIVIQHLTFAEPPPMLFSESKGYVEGPACPPNPISPSDFVTDKKIVVYFEFALLIPMMKSVLELHGIPTLSIHGKMSVKARADAITNYKKNDKYRVLLISSVGSAGLNLTVANVMIIFDQPWSQSVEQQIIGRVWRFGQTKPVTVYKLLAIGTTDALVNHMAEGKGLQSAAFLGRDMSEKLLNIMRQKKEPSASDDESDDEIDVDFNGEISEDDRKNQQVQSKKPPTAKSRRGKSAAVITEGKDNNVSAGATSNRHPGTTPTTSKVVGIAGDTATEELASKSGEKATEARPSTKKGKGPSRSSGAASKRKANATSSVAESSLATHRDDVQRNPTPPLAQDQTHSTGSLPHVPVTPPKDVEAGAEKRKGAPSPPNFLSPRLQRPAKHRSHPPVGSAAYQELDGSVSCDDPFLSYNSFDTSISTDSATALIAGISLGEDSLPSPVFLNLPTDMSGHRHPAGLRTPTTPPYPSDQRDARNNSSAIQDGPVSVPSVRVGSEHTAIGGIVQSSAVPGSEDQDPEVSHDHGVRRRDPRSLGASMMNRLNSSRSASNVMPPVAVGVNPRSASPSPFARTRPPSHAHGSSGKGPSIGRKNVHLGVASTVPQISAGLTGTPDNVHEDVVHARARLRGHIRVDEGNLRAAEPESSMIRQRASSIEWDGDVEMDVEDPIENFSSSARPKDSIENFSSSAQPRFDQYGELSQLTSMAPTPAESRIDNGSDDDKLPPSDDALIESSPSESENDHVAPEEPDRQRKMRQNTSHGQYQSTVPNPRVRVPVARAGDAPAQAGPSKQYSFNSSNRFSSSDAEKVTIPAKMMLAPAPKPKPKPKSSTRVKGSKGK